MALLTDYLAQRWDEDEAQLRHPPRRGSLTDERTAALDPERILAEIAVKRRLLVLHRPVWPEEADDPRCATCGDGRFEDYRGPWPCVTLLTLAQPFAGHPQFEQAWAMPNAHDASPWS